MRRDHKEKEGMLPAGYTQLEYIESQGNQWIDTGQCLTTDLKWYLKVQWTSLTNNNPQGFGTERWNNTPLTIARIYQRRGNSTQGFVFGDTSAYANYAVSPDYSIHEISVENGSQTYDGVVVSNGTLSNDGSAANDTILLLAVHGNGAVQYKCTNTRLYSSVMWKNGVQIRNFIPALRLSDNNPGLYDIVNDRFYVNQGSGEFLYA